MQKSITKEVGNPDYIKFVVSRVEADLASCGAGSEYAKISAVLQSMKSADNILREAYVLSGIKKLRKLAFYLVFMYKKIESNRITLDNFLENFRTDKEYLEHYFQTYYNLEVSEEPQEEEPETEKFIIDASREKEEDEEVYSLTEPSFKIETIESELVNEEFIESSPLSDLEIAGDRYLRLVEKDNIPEAAFAGPEQAPEEGDVFSLPVNVPEAATESAGETRADTHAENASPGAEEKNLADFFEELDGKEAAAAKKTDREEKEQLIQKLQEEYREQIKDVIITEDNFGESAEENRAEEYPVPAGVTRAPIETDAAVDKELKQIEDETAKELINSEFTEYETDLYEKNNHIRGIFDELITIANDRSPDYSRRDALLKDLCDTAQYLKEKSGSMTFEIITRIYDSVIFCFSQKFKDIVVSEETISVFREAVNGVEKLVRGDELGSLGTTIKKVENVENELKQMLELREEYEKKKYDFGEEERKIIEDFKDDSEKEAYLHLRDRILELERLFGVHIQMKDKIHPFESLRKLSSTFTVYREIVNVSGILEMTKMARLAEAGYVFVKFIQNYRIDPFKDDVLEIFRFMIYSFKLIYLDKPVKELETFVSYLNDPVKIFHQKKEIK